MPYTPPVPPPPNNRRFSGPLPSDLQPNDVVEDLTGGLWVWAGNLFTYHAGANPRAAGDGIIVRPTQYAGRRPGEGLVYLAVTISDLGSPMAAEPGVSAVSTEMPADVRAIPSVIPGVIHIPLARVRGAEILPILRGNLAIAVPGAGVTQNIDVRLADGSTAILHFQSGQLVWVTV